jgi:adenine phosphoribosyltransferase
VNRGAARERLTELIRDVPDWPQPGVVFKDITPLLRDAAAFSSMVEMLADTGRDDSGAPAVDVVAGIEARGFILAAPVAERLGTGFVPVRKAGKLPHETSSATYQLEYGEATIEVHKDAFQPGDRVLLIDDVLATGGTVNATLELIGQSGAAVTCVSVLMELTFLNGRAKLPDVPFSTILTT